MAAEKVSVIPAPAGLHKDLLLLSRDVFWTHTPESVPSIDDSSL
jgi:hypothetical protein